jgi:hypothetical protein
MNYSPIFIAGPDRSGTTLLYALLASHSNIAMVRRTNFWRWFYGRYGNLDNEENFERLLDNVLRYQRIEPLMPDEDRIRKEFRQGPPSYGRFFMLLLKHYAERQGKSRWGDKSLHTESYINYVVSEFPDAKIIYTLRDPRDRYASVRKRFGKDIPRVGAATGEWLSSFNAAMKSVKKYPENFMIIKFEDLVSETESTCRKICRFIDEKYDPTMLTLQGASRYQENNGNSSFEKIEPGVISKKPVGRYKTVLSQSELSFIQFFTGNHLHKMGYQMEENKLSYPEKMKMYLWFFPPQLLRMLRWLTSVSFTMKRPKVPENRFNKEILNPINNSEVS